MADKKTKYPENVEQTAENFFFTKTVPAYFLSWLFMKMKLISVIIPAYNVEKYIERTIRSVQDQTYSNLEIICVNDGSHDSTYEVLCSLAKTDKRVRVFSKQNEGVTIARKFGFEQAQGEFIGFVDADDEIDPTLYETLYNNMIKYSVDISHCGHDVRSLNGQTQYFYNTGRVLQKDRNTGIKALLEGSFEPSLCNKLYKSSLLNRLFKSGVMNYTIKINEDLLMNYYLFKEAESSILEDVCLYHYLKREGSASTSHISHNFIWDQINVKGIILSDAIGTPYENDAQKAYLTTCLAKYNTLIRQNDFSYEQDIEDIRSIIKECKKSIKLLNIKQSVGASILLYAPRLYNKLLKTIL